jgi:hypothetical protein
MFDSKDYARFIVDTAVGREAHESSAHKASVSFGANSAFDRQVAKLRNSLAEVIVEARVTDKGWTEVYNDGSFAICADRCNQLQPVRLVRVLQQEPLLRAPPEKAE